MLEGAPPNSKYLPPTEFYTYGECVLTRLEAADGGGCMRVMYPGDSFFSTDNMLWSVVDYREDDLTAITAEEFVAQVNARGGSLVDLYPGE